MESVNEKDKIQVFERLIKVETNIDNVCSRVDEVCGDVKKMMTNDLPHLKSAIEKVDSQVCLTNQKLEELGIDIEKSQSRIKWTVGLIVSIISLLFLIINSVIGYLEK